MADVQSAASQTLADRLAAVAEPPALPTVSPHAVLSDVNRSLHQSQQRTPVSPMHAVEGPARYALSTSDRLLRGQGASLTPSADPPTLNRSTMPMMASDGSPAPAAISASVSPGQRRLLTSSATAGSPQPQAEMIQAIVQASLDEFRTALHQDVHNMHVDLIRQFEIQKVRLPSLVW